MPFLMSFALEHEIVTFAWIDNASVQFPLNIYATKGLSHVNLLIARANEKGWPLHTSEKIHLVKRRFRSTGEMANFLKTGGCGHPRSNHEILESASRSRPWRIQELE